MTSKSKPSLTYLRNRIADIRTTINNRIEAAYPSKKQLSLKEKWAAIRNNTAKLNRAAMGSDMWAHAVDIFTYPGDAERAAIEKRRAAVFASTFSAFNAEARALEDEVALGNGDALTLLRKFEAKWLAKKWGSA